MEKMKAKIIKTGTINGRTYLKHLVYMVHDTTYEAMVFNGMVEDPEGKAKVKVENIVIKAPKGKGMTVKTGSPEVSTPTLTGELIEEAPKKTRKPRTKKVTKEEKFEDGNS